MKYTAIAVLLLTVAAPGCLTLPNLGEPPPVVEKEPEKAVAPKPSVKADDISEQNAHQMANQLQAELDREMGQPAGTGKPVKVRP
jgi:hypothetical protein